MYTLRFWNAYECVKEVSFDGTLKDAKRMAMRYLYEDYGMDADVNECSILNEQGEDVECINFKNINRRIAQ